MRLECSGPSSSPVAPKPVPKPVSLQLPLPPFRLCLRLRLGLRPDRQSVAGLPPRAARHDSAVAAAAAARSQPARSLGRRAAQRRAVRTHTATQRKELPPESALTKALSEFEVSQGMRVDLFQSLQKFADTAEGKALSGEAARFVDRGNVAGRTVRAKRTRSRRLSAKMSPVTAWLLRRRVTLLFGCVRL